MPTVYEFDATLRASGQPFRRYPNLTAIGYDAAEAKDSLKPYLDAQIEHFRSEITRLLLAKFKTPAMARTDYGQLVNLDEALDGIPECFRHTRRDRKTLRIGLNLSADACSDDKIFAVRCAAVIALFQLAKQRGQFVQMDIAYGNGLKRPTCHVRVSVQRPTVDIIKGMMGSGYGIRLVGENAVAPLSPDKHWYGLYRFHELNEHFGKKEFDFVLDRIEYGTFEQEYKRIIDQIEHLK